MADDPFLLEYEKLKDEQVARIGFRDNLLYATLGVVGALAAFAIQANSPVAFLIIPWATLILGWTYLVNDDKISAIGRYYRDILLPHLKNRHGNDAKLFGWEVYHRSDKRRGRRKLEQLIIDELTFVGSGVAAVIAYQQTVPIPPTALAVITWIAGGLLLVLAIEIAIYADLRSGK